MKYEKLDRFISSEYAMESDNTIKSYVCDITLFLNNMAEKKSITDEIELLKSITNDDVEDWIKEQRGCAFTTINRKIIILKKYFRYIAVNKKIIPFSPFDGIKEISPPKNILKAKQEGKLLYKLKEKKTCISLEEVWKLINSTYTRGYKERSFEFTSVRDRFLLSMLFTTGLRIEELLNVKVNQIKPYDYGFMIEGIPSKTGVVKRVPIANKSLGYYNNYLSAREKYKNGKKSDYLIINERGNKCTDQYINEKLSKLVDKAEIDKHITCHSFRYGFKTYSTAKGINTDVIALIGGWKNDLSNQADTYLTNDGGLDKQIVEACNLL